MKAGAGYGKWRAVDRAARPEAASTELTPGGDRTFSVSVRHERISGVLRVLTLATVLALIGLITLGGVVRVTDSGLGCPDWPLCHGRIIPATDSATLIEYSHRMLATITGLTVFTVVVLVWRAYRPDRWLTRVVTVGFVLLIAQVVLGGATVRTDLDSGLVMAHLAVAQVLLAVMTVAMVMVWQKTGNPDSRVENAAYEAPRRPLLIPIAVAGVYVLLLTGSYVQASEATGACGDTWPLCQGELFPSGELALTHMLHRFLSILVGGVLVAALVEAWRLGKDRPSLRIAALGVGGLFVAQIFIGGINVWLAFPHATNALHLAIATTVWACLVTMAVLSYSFAQRGKERSYAA